MKPLRFLVPALLLIACTHEPDLVQIPGNARSGDLVAYVGIVPSAVARDRMAADATAQHPAVTADSHHLVVALFDASSGTRVDRADVIATHVAPRRQPVRRVLAPMRTGDVVSFGGEFEIGKGPDHLFEIEVRRPDRPPVRFSLTYDNRHP